MTGGAGGAGGGVSDLLSLRLRNFIGDGEERAGGQQSSQNPTSSQLSFCFGWSADTQRRKEIQPYALRGRRLTEADNYPSRFVAMYQCPNVAAVVVVVVVALSLSSLTKKPASVQFGSVAAREGVDCTIHVIDYMS